MHGLLASVRMWAGVKNMLWTKYRDAEVGGSKARSFLTVLKEDDDACSKAQASGKFLLFHNLSPLLQKEGHEGYSAPLFAAADVKGILGKLGQSDNILETSVLIGCSQDSETQFALDLGPAIGELPYLQVQLPSTLMAPVVISLVSDGTRCLLARQKSFPKGMYSALAGFCDIGKITVNDQELEDARWFTADEIKRALERKKLPREQEAGIIPFWVPPRTAIANQLIQEWINKQSK
ncbi:NUD13 protein, partial [Polypterus senegalus]